MCCGASGVFWGLILRFQVYFRESGMFKDFRYDLEIGCLLGEVLWVQVCLGGRFWGVRCVFRGAILGCQVCVWGGDFGVTGVCLRCQVCVLGGDLEGSVVLGVHA